MTERPRAISKNENPPVLSIRPNLKVNAWRNVWTLHCPICGRGKIFRKFLSMAPACKVCGFVYEREQGYFLGAMYINYGVSLLAVLAGWIVLEFIVKASSERLVWGLAIIAIAIAICFYPYSKALWMAIDLRVDPLKTEAKAKSAQPQIQERSDPKP